MNQYASLYVAAGASAQALLAASFSKVTGFATAGYSSSDRGNLGAVNVIASDKITLQGGRRYLVLVDFSFTHGDAAAQELTLQLYLAGAAVAHAISTVTCTNAKKGFLAIHAIVAPAAGSNSDLELYGKTSADMNVTPVNARMTAFALD